MYKYLLPLFLIGCTGSIDSDTKTEKDVLSLTDSSSCAPLEVVSIYESKSGDGSGYHSRGKATVNLERPGRQILMVSSYEATEWEIKTIPGVILEGIIASGYYKQQVVAPAGVPIQTFSLDEGSYLAGSIAVDWTKAGTLITHAERISGQKLTAFHGCYRMNDITLHADLSAVSNCDTYAGYHLSSEVRTSICLPDPTDPCAGATGDGEYRGKFCDYPAGMGSIYTGVVSCSDALANCELNQRRNPGLSIACNWTQAGKTRVLLVDEKRPGICAPYLGPWPLPPHP